VFKKPREEVNNFSIAGVLAVQVAAKGNKALLLDGGSDRFIPPALGRRLAPNPG